MWYYFSTFDSSNKRNAIMTTEEMQKIQEQIESELKESAHWLGGWNELRKLIDQLEENDNEAAAERYYSKY